MNHVDKTSIAYGMQINAENTKLMTNNNNGINKYKGGQPKTGNCSQIQIPWSNCYGQTIQTQMFSLGLRKQPKCSQNLNTCYLEWSENYTWNKYYTDAHTMDIDTLLCM